MNPNDTEKIPLRVRFAPSPTGELHVGGARTALFNYLLARSQGGAFLLRLEDTDRQRSKPEFIQSILDGLRWLGLEWDEEPQYQSHHAAAHREAVDLLLQKGLAYRCFCSPAELERKRTAAREAGKPYQYDGTCRQRTPEERAALAAAGRPFVVRFAVPEGITRFKDLIFKRMEVKNETVEDFILLRSDGTPTYQLAVVVDDHAQQISHVLRGADHLSNTPKQIMLYRALEYPVPRFGHLPLILGPDGKRLSKRHGARSVLAYAKEGILPAALFNFLALLGWSPKNNREFMPPEEIIHAFALGAVRRTPAVFDEAKLLWLNGKHLRSLDPVELYPMVAPRLQARLGSSFTSRPEDYNRRAITLLQSKMHTLNDFGDRGSYCWKDPESYDPEGVQHYFQNENTAERLELVRQRLETCPDFSPETVEKTIRGLAAELDIKAAELIHPIRLALTGSRVSPSLFELMSLLGKDVCLRRLRHTILALTNGELKHVQ